jgi:hypothetical protein
VNRRYRPGTLVLETEFQTETGRAAIVDFMPPADGADLVRIVMGRSGRVDFRTEYVARFNYGATVPWVRRFYHGAISAVAGPERLVLRSQVALRGDALAAMEDLDGSRGDPHVRKCLDALQFKIPEHIVRRIDVTRVTSLPALVAPTADTRLAICGATTGVDEENRFPDGDVEC